jgi:hypothetical protein
VTDETRDIPNTSRVAAAEGYNIGYASPKKSYWELNNDLLVEAYERIGALEANSGSTSAEGVQASLDGQVVPVGEGLDVTDAVAVDSSSNPFNEAGDKLPTSGGAIILPPEPVLLEDGNPALPPAGVSIFGWGMGASQTGAARSSTIQQTVPDTDVLAWNNGGNSRNIRVAGIHLQGPDESLDSASSTGYGIHLQSPLNDAVFHNIRATHLTSAVIRSEPGVSPTGVTFDHLGFGQIDIKRNAGACIDFADNQGWQWRFGMIDGYTTDKVTGEMSTIVQDYSIGGTRIDVLNVGGYIDAAVDQGGSYDGLLSIGQTNFEPTGAQEAGFVHPAVFDLTGEQPVHLGPTMIRVANVTDVVRSTEHAGNQEHGNTTIDLIGINPGSSVAGAKVSIEGDTTAPITYQGLSSEVVNNSGGPLSVPVQCLGDGQPVPEPTAVFVAPTTDQSIPTAFTKVEFGTEFEDTRGEFDTGASEFSPRERGRYAVEASVSFTQAQTGDNLKVNLRANGGAVAVRNVGSAFTGYRTVLVGKDLTLTPNDTIDVVAQNTTRDDRLFSNETQTYLTVSRLG